MFNAQNEDLPCGVDQGPVVCQTFRQFKKRVAVAEESKERMSWEHLTRDLNLILNSFVDLIGCDGGSIYTLEKDANGEEHLVFKAMVTRSTGIRAVPDQLKSVVFKLNESTLVGKTGFQRKVFKEVAQIQPVKEGTDEGLSEGSSSFPTPGSDATDNMLGYKTKSILSAPLLTPRGDLVGVVQLVNKNNQQHFDEQDERLCAIVSGQAALAIENSRLLYEQEQILDGFVNACVTAIEARDPVTSGHSQRVCDLSLNFAEAINKTNTGNLALVHFTSMQMRELRYAAMLHDIGKISVKEDILKKEKKLYPWELEMIRMRFKLMKAALKIEYGGERNQLELARKLKELDQAWNMIVSANEPTVLPQEVSQGIIELTKFQVKVDEHETECALHDHEKDRLCIQRGSLSKEERIEIEQHVAFTYEILKMVPWSRGLEQVPNIAHRHHEKLDGTGYPKRVKAEEIPIQSRMITICDIFDALTAADRPYKAAVPLDRALFILEEEVKQGKLDSVLYRLFVDSRAYMIPVKKDKKKAA